MYGLAAIQQANGWAMAGLGAGIVLSGLAVLAFLISLIPRLTALFEPKPPVQEKSIPTMAPPSAIVIPDKLPADIRAASAIYINLTENLGKEFTLGDLHRKSKELGLPHPHMSINRFRTAGILVSINGDGDRFAWQPICE